MDIDACGHCGLVDEHERYSRGCMKCGKPVTTHFNTTKDEVLQNYLEVFNNAKLILEANEVIQRF